jgi:hypothetical protein
VTDDPERFSKGLADLWLRVKRDALVPIGSKKLLEQASLKELVLAPSAQAVVLSALATISFSAYVYYAFASAFNGLPEDQRHRAILFKPLFHRLSKKGERFVQVHTRVSGVQVVLKQVSAEVALRFHRTAEIPKPGSARYSNLAELANFLAWTVGQHLSQPSDLIASAIFESFRTRIRYAENVVTGEKHTRDVNPLL